ncbi:MAG: hypothetical protein ACRCZS_28260 [Chroococcidiopsis sp.]
MAEEVIPVVVSDRFFEGFKGKFNNFKGKGLTLPENRTRDG